MTTRNRAIQGAVAAGHLIRCFIGMPRFRIDLAFICGKVRRRRAAVQLARTVRGRKLAARYVSAFAFVAYHSADARVKAANRNERPSDACHPGVLDLSYAAAAARYEGADYLVIRYRRTGSFDTHGCEILAGGVLSWQVRATGRRCSQ